MSNPLDIPKLHLPFPYTLLSWWQKGDRRVALVERKDAFSPFVVYRVDAEGNCFWGNYITGDNRAEADRAFRIKCRIADGNACAQPLEA